MYSCAVFPKNADIQVNYKFRYVGQFPPRSQFFQQQNLVLLTKYTIIAWEDDKRNNTIFNACNQICLFIITDWNKDVSFFLLLIPTILLNIILKAISIMKHGLTIY